MEIVFWFKLFFDWKLDSFKSKIYLICNETCVLVFWDLKKNVFIYDTMFSHLTGVKFIAKKKLQHELKTVVKDFLFPAKTIDASISVDFVLWKKKVWLRN